MDFLRLRAKKVLRSKHIKSSFVMVPIEFEATFQRRPAGVVEWAVNSLDFLSRFTGPVNS